MTRLPGWRAKEIKAARNINRACSDLRRLVGAPRRLPNETVCRLAAEKMSQLVPDGRLARRIAAARAVVARETGELVAPRFNLPVRLARRYARSDYDFSEVVAEGRLGLMEAALSYRPSFHNKFETYAARRIKQTLPRRVRELGGPPAAGEARGEPRDPEQSAIDRELLVKLERKNRQLTPRELETLYLRFVRGLSLAKAGEQLHVRFERVWKIQQAALNKLADRAIMPAGPGKAESIPEAGAIARLAAAVIRHDAKPALGQSEEVRDIVMYLAREFGPDLSYQEIGAPFLLGREAVVSGIRRTACRCGQDAVFRDFVFEIAARLRV